VNLPWDGAWPPAACDFGPRYPFGVIPKRTSDGYLATEAEFRAERASALRRVAFNLERLLAQLASAEEQLKSPLTTPIEREELERAHEQARRDAEKQLWYLVVQREAMGLRNHDGVYEIYKVPESLTRALRPPDH
jgi:hypothetical protein